MVENNKIKWILGAISLSVWIVLIALNQTTEISLKFWFWVGIATTIAFGLSFFWKNISELIKKARETESEKKPMSKEDVDNMIEKILIASANYIKKGTVKAQETHTVNNAIIYEDRLILYHKQFLDGENTNKITILINATFPEMRPYYMKTPTNREELLEKVNRMAGVMQNIERTETSVDTFGRPMQTRTLVKYESDEDKKDEGDVV